MRIVRAGDTYRDSFAVQASTGAAANADSLPTAAVYKNGTVDGAVTVTVTNVTAGAYTLSFTVPVGYAAGDVIQALVTAVIGGVTVVGWSSPVTVAGFPATALPNAAAGANAGLPVLSVSGTTLGYTVSTLTTYTGNTPQTGDSFSRIGATGAGLTSLATASTALSTAQWTNAKAAFLDEAVSAPKTLTSAERIAVANEVEAQIIDETDSEKVLTAITDKIASVNPSLSGLTLGAIASAVRDVSNASPAANSLGAAVNAVKLRTDNLPDDPADQSLIIAGTDAIMTRLGAPTGASVSVDIAGVAAAAASQVTADHGAGSYLRNTEPTNPTDYARNNVAPSWYSAPVDVSTNVSAIKAKTDNLPADPTGLMALATAHGTGSWATATGFAVAGSPMTLADGAITDAKFSVPAESGPPTGVVGMLVWLAQRLGLRRVRKTSTTIQVYAANGTTVRTTNTYTSVGTTDDVGAAT